MCRFSKSVLITVVMAMIIAAAATTVYADDRGQTVTITKVGSNLVADYPAVTIFPQPTDVVYFLNKTGALMNVNNTVQPPGGTDKDGPTGNDVDSNAAQMYTFTCNADGGDWVFNVSQDGANPVNVTVTVGCSPRPVPSLTTYGVILLVLLLLGATIWVVRKKRATAAV